MRRAGQEAEAVKRLSDAQIKAAAERTHKVWLAPTKSLAVIVSFGNQSKNNEA